MNPIADLRHEIAKKDIVKRSVAKTSAMPEGLLNVLSRDEILDLLAFIEADAKPGAAAFATK